MPQALTPVDTEGGVDVPVERAHDFPGAIGGVHIEMVQHCLEATAIARTRVPFTHVDTPLGCVLIWFCVARPLTGAS